LQLELPAKFLHLQAEVSASEFRDAHFPHLQAAIRGLFFSLQVELFLHLQAELFTAFSEDEYQVCPGAAERTTDKLRHGQLKAEN
jgi:hypothetical protein